jgi:hypothetical protein
MFLKIWAYDGLWGSGQEMTQGRAHGEGKRASLTLVNYCQWRCYLPTFSIRPRAGLLQTSSGDAENDPRTTQNNPMPVASR